MRFRERERHIHSFFLTVTGSKKKGFLQKKRTKLNLHSISRTIIKKFWLEAIIDCKIVHSESFLLFVTGQLLSTLEQKFNHAFQIIINLFLNAVIVYTFNVKAPGWMNIFWKTLDLKQPFTITRRFKAVDHSKHVRENIKTYKLNWKSLKDLWIFKIYILIQWEEVVFCVWAKQLISGRYCDPWPLNKIL